MAGVISNMKQVIILTLLSIVSAKCMAERVFDEKTLQSWGYETHEINSKHEIKSIHNYGDSNVAFYARFTLWNKCYKNKTAATKEIQRIEEERLSTVMGQQKNYQRMIQHGKCVYFVQTYSNYTYLSHQPSLLKKVKLYVSENHL